MLDVAIYNSRQHDQWRYDSGPLVLARSRGNQGVWQSLAPARAKEAGEILEIRALGTGVWLQLSNLDDTTAPSAELADLAAGRVLDLPARLVIGDALLEIVDVACWRRRAPHNLHELFPEVAHGSETEPRQHAPASTTLARWFKALGTLHHWKASSQECFVDAARFVVDSIGLDGAILLRRREAQWEIVTSDLPDPELGILCDFDVLDRLLVTPLTLFDGSQRSETSDPNRLSGESVTRLLSRTQWDRGEYASVNHQRRPGDPHAIVVAPLFDGVGAVTGAIYGFRAVHRGNSRRRIRHLEARLVELLASSVSGGIARLEREAKEAWQRVLFEQAFIPSVVRDLERDPTVLHGQEREISILFADLRNFTSLCAALGTAASYELLNDVMDCLTNSVLDHEGVVIDYYGDGLSAMWNAPLAQSHHAELACRAALTMQETLPQVSQRWRNRLPRPLRIGVGVHTGVAQVGNVGSSRRLKYGPRGPSVNLASRVEAATKRLRLPVLVTGATASGLSNRLLSYRVCQARLPGVPQVVELFALSRSTTEQRVMLDVQRYEQALRLYEGGKLAEAEQLLSSAPLQCEEVPTRFLTEYLRSYRRQQPGRRENDRPLAEFGPVIELDVN